MVSDHIENDGNDMVEDGEVSSEEAGFMQGEESARMNDSEKDDKEAEAAYEAAFKD